MFDAAFMIRACASNLGVCISVSFLSFQFASFLTAPPFSALPWRSGLS